MTNKQLVQQFLETAEAIKAMLDKCEYLAEDTERQAGYIDRLKAENRKLKYEYEDSKLKRDVPMPYKWKAKKGKTSMENRFRMFCPKCGAGIVNWYNYCPLCGQKILQGNPQESERIPWEDDTE